MLSELFAHDLCKLDVDVCICRVQGRRDVCQICVPEVAWCHFRHDFDEKLHVNRGGLYFCAVLRRPELSKLLHLLHRWQFVHLLCLRHLVHLRRQSRRSCQSRCGLRFIRIAQIDDVEDHNAALNGGDAGKIGHDPGGEAPGEDAETLKRADMGREARRDRAEEAHQRRQESRSAAQAVARYYKLQPTVDQHTHPVRVVQVDCTGESGRAGWAILASAAFLRPPRDIFRPRPTYLARKILVPEVAISTLPGLVPSPSPVEPLDGLFVLVALQQAVEVRVVAGQPGCSGALADTRHRQVVQPVAVHDTPERRLRQAGRVRAFLTPQCRYLRALHTP